MGTIDITFAGSFGAVTSDHRKTFRAIEHGHVRATRDAIAYLRNEILPQAVVRDAALRKAGEEPREGFTKSDTRWLDAHDAALDGGPGGAVPQLEELMHSLGGRLDDVFPPGWVWALVACSAGAAGAMTYLSNGDREGMVGALRELLAKLEAGDSGTLGQPIASDAPEV